MKTKIMMLAIAVAVAAGANAQNSDKSQDINSLKKDKAGINQDKEIIDNQRGQIHKENKLVDHDVRAISQDWVKIKADKKAGNKAALTEDWAKLKRDHEAYNKDDAAAHQAENTMKQDDRNLDKQLGDFHGDLKDIRKDNSSAHHSTPKAGKVEKKH